MLGKYFRLCQLPQLVSLMLLQPEAEGEPSLEGFDRLGILTEGAVFSGTLP